MTLGETLKAARKLRGASQCLVAERCGCSQGMVSKLERDKASPSLRLLIRLAEVLGLRFRLELSTADQRREG